MGPPGVLGIWGEGLFIFRELGSTANYFRGAGEQAHTFWDLGSEHCQKVKKINIRLPFYLILRNVVAPDPPPYINVISFQFLYISFQKKNDCMKAFFLGTYRLMIWREAWVIFAKKKKKTCFLRCFHFICYRSPDPHNCCKLFL